MNKKIMVAIVALLATAMVATSMLGTVEACGCGRHWWWPRPNFCLYTVEVTVGPPVVTYNDASGAPFCIIVEGYRPSTSVVECTITVNGVEYYYPEDFEYEELWHMEINAVAGEANLTATTTYTFINLPGKPSISEHIVAKQTNIGTPEENYAGTFVLSGTKLLHRVGGGGYDTAYYEGEEPNRVLVISRTGLIKGWPFWLR